MIGRFFWLRSIGEKVGCQTGMAACGACRLAGGEVGVGVGCEVQCVMMSRCEGTPCFLQRRRRGVRSMSSESRECRRTYSLSGGSPLDGLAQAAVKGCLRRES